MFNFNRYWWVLIDWLSSLLLLIWINGCLSSESFGRISGSLCVWIVYDWYWRGLFFWPIVLFFFSRWRVSCLRLRSVLVYCWVQVFSYRSVAKSIRSKQVVESRRYESRVRFSSLIKLSFKWSVLKNTKFSDFFLNFSL